MAILRDFVVNQGLVVNTTATVNGVDVLANDFATLQAAYANDVATYTTLDANTYNTYTTLDGRINTVQGNVASFESGYSANDYNTYTTLDGRINTVQGNVTSFESGYSANDYNTYTTLDGRINTVQGNVTAVELGYSANDYNTYTTLDGRINAVQGNVAAVELGYAANDYNTYTTLDGRINAVQGNVAAVELAYAANDYNSYLTAMSNDGATLASARANDYGTYTTLVNEYRANDYTTYTTLLSGYSANDYATWSGLNAYVNQKANASANVIAGDGITGGGPLTGNVSIAVDASVVRTSGVQNIGGIKTFTDSVVIAGDLTVEGNTTTIGTTNLLVEDKFIELGANTTGTPVGDVGLYLNRGNQGNSAIYYDQSAGYFALADTSDPTTNTEVSPSSYAALRVGTLIVSNTSVVTNLNADALDGQSGAYYVDFANATNTDIITLARVTANGAVTSDAITVGGLTVDSNTVHVDTTNNFVGIRTVTPRAPLQVEALGVATSTLVTAATTANQVLDSFAASAFRTVKYLIQVHDTANNDYHACEILLIHDGTTAYITEYAIVYSDISLASFNADVSGGNARLLVTPTNTTNTIRVVRSALAV